MGNVIITLKDPDGIYDSIEDFIENEISIAVDEDEKECLTNVKREKIKKILSKWIKYGEYITIEFDIDAETYKILENK